VLQCIIYFIMKPDSLSKILSSTQLHQVAMITIFTVWSAYCLSGFCQKACTQHTAAHWSIRQHTAPLCTTLYYVAPHCAGVTPPLFCGLAKRNTFPPINGLLDYLEKRSSKNYKTKNAFFCFAAAASDWKHGISAMQKVFSDILGDLWNRLILWKI